MEIWLARRSWVSFIVFTTLSLLIVTPPCLGSKSSPTAMQQQCQQTPTTTLSNGKILPLLGLGTWKSDPGEVGAAIKEAIKLGYHHIDCAAIYGNEADIGEALEECLKGGMVTREELFITSKLWNDSHSPEDVLPALQKTLKDLRLDYLDMYLIHWPVHTRKGAKFPFTADKLISPNEIPIASTWGEMEKLVDQGLSRGIGVSNFSVKKIKEILKSARIPPAINQIERHPYLQVNEVVEFCKSNGIVVTAFSPLGSMDRPARVKGPEMPILLQDETVTAIARKHSVSPAQVLLKWAIQTGTAVIPKSTNPQRLAENLASPLALTLDTKDMEDLAKMDRRARYIDGSIWTPPNSPYTLRTLWDADY